MPDETPIYKAGTTKFFTDRPDGLPNLLAGKKWKIAAVYANPHSNWYWIIDTHNVNRQLRISAAGWENTQ